MHEAIQLFSYNTNDSPKAVPSCVVTVTVYSFEAGRLALRKTVTDVVSSDTLYSNGLMLTVITTDNEEKVSKE